NPAPCGLVGSGIGVRGPQGQNLAAPNFRVPVSPSPHLTGKTPGLHPSRIECKPGESDGEYHTHEEGDEQVQ
ncbi:hypothetical protein Taro_033763, partial [Colocasia esculenta]|nr:hypothetical protein [Colocasia esculenta]